MKRESESNRTGGKPNSEHDCIGSWHRIVGAPHALFREVYACRFTMLSLPGAKGGDRMQSAHGNSGLTLCGPSLSGSGSQDEPRDEQWLSPPSQ